MQVFHSKSTQAIRLSEGSNELHTFLLVQVDGHERTEADGPLAFLAIRRQSGFKVWKDNLF